MHFMFVILGFLMTISCILAEECLNVRGTVKCPRSLPTDLSHDGKPIKIQLKDGNLLASIYL